MTGLIPYLIIDKGSSQGPSLVRNFLKMTSLFFHKLYVTSRSLCHLIPYTVSSVSFRVPNRNSF